ncbi:MAG: alpha/beta hydrolase family protein, partial [Blastocatellia bacterium]
MNRKLILPAVLFIAVAFSFKALAQEIPATDSRREVRHLDLPYTLADYKTKEAWLARAAELRKQILVSAGLWPTPQKQPIKATIFGKLDRGDHTVEKVYFESYPGFYVTGNLYRPKNTTGKLPAVLCPHGHWAYGRLENQPLHSGPARAISFARQGYVAFSYDMVGYNDSSAITHTFANHNSTGVEALWGINLLGLQLWDSIRAVDFLLTLPEVDADRIACTGESGGGTQTFLLTAVDERIRLAAPVNMVSFIMQGGSLCENAPNLRVDTNNVEIAALMAPRAMMLVSATGDWTKNMLTSEHPAVRSIYRLFGAEDKLTAIRIDA